MNSLALYIFFKWLKTNYEPNGTNTEKELEEKLNELEEKSKFYYKRYVQLLGRHDEYGKELINEIEQFMNETDAEYVRLSKLLSIYQLTRLVEESAPSLKQLFEIK